MHCMQTHLCSGRKLANIPPHAYKFQWVSPTRKVFRVMREAMAMLTEQKIAKEKEREKAEKEKQQQKNKKGTQKGRVGAEVEEEESEIEDEVDGGAEEEGIWGAGGEERLGWFSNLIPNGLSL